MQRPGHRNLLEKTKVMASIRQKIGELVAAQSETATPLLDETRLIELKSWPASHCETKSHAESLDFTQRHPHPPFPLTQIEMQEYFPNRFKHL